MDKILFLEWKSFGNNHIINEFIQKGYVVERFPFPRESEDTRLGTDLAEQVAGKILEDNYAFVFSFNYFPVVAVACKACRVRYVSWVYDSPYIQLYSQTVFFPTNRIFLFDRAEYEKLLRFGVANIYYLPMAAATDYYDTFIPNEAIHCKYDTDVAFIGSMYSEKKQHLFRHLDDLDDYTRGFLFGVMEAQKNIYGMNFLEESLTPEIIDSMRKVCPVTKNTDGFETVEWVFANYFLARKITAMERQELLKQIETICKVNLYTPEPTPLLPNTKNCGKIDYYEEAPYAMKCAKINLNITLKSIQTGMPLRALDIMGCGGFLLTNFQSDFLEFFEPGTDFVYYENKKDFEEKIKYYLTHEEERKKIAKNGYEKAKNQLSYRIQVQKMLDCI